MLKGIGFWYSSDQHSLVHPKRLVDPTWQSSNRTKIVAYLRAGTEYCARTSDFLRVVSNAASLTTAWVAQS
jgi:hypothetical protein